MMASAKHVEDAAVSATSAAAAAGAGAPPAAKRAAATAKKAAKAAAEATEEGAEAVAVAVSAVAAATKAEEKARKAEEKARKAEEKALREATAAAKKAERDAAKEAKVAEKAAKVAARTATAKRTALPSGKPMTAKQRANAQRRRLRNAWRAVKAGENVNTNTRMAADAYKMLRLAEMETGDAGRESNISLSRRSSRRRTSSNTRRLMNAAANARFRRTARLMKNKKPDYGTFGRIVYRPASAMSNSSAGYASAASGSAPRPAPRPASAASPIGSNAFDEEKRRAAQNAALAALMEAQGPVNLY